MAYLALSTANLPDPVIDPAQGATADQYFDTLLYTGTGTYTVRSGLDLANAPGLIWIKGRSTASDHVVMDSVRGTSVVFANGTASTNAEGATGGGWMQNFSTTGFSTDVNGPINTNGVTYVSWVWAGSGSNVTNTDGSITSTVSANTTSGTSIITWTGNATLSATIGHGLSSSPEMIIVKNRSVTNSWIVQHHSVTGYLTLNGTGAAAGSNVFTPSSTTIQFDSTWDAINGSGNNMLCYAFHSVEGFSKIGKWSGTSDTDGPFVYLGFRPAFVLFKRNGTANWVIYDKERDPFNYVDDRLFPNVTDAESGGGASYSVDWLSNGMKIRTNGSQWNQSGSDYIYMAFAESPFKYATAR
jgi:hypothetical protein